MSLYLRKKYHMFFQWYFNDISSFVTYLNTREWLIFWLQYNPSDVSTRQIQYPMATQHTMYTWKRNNCELFVFCHTVLLVWCGYLTHLLRGTHFVVFLLLPSTRVVFIVNVSSTNVMRNEQSCARDFKTLFYSSLLWLTYRLRNICMNVVVMSSAFGDVNSPATCRSLY